jgi:hypothetical protein
MHEHTFKNTRVLLVADQPADIHTILVGRSSDGTPATPEDRTLLIRASAPTGALAEADDGPLAGASTPCFALASPAYQDGMFGEYVALERSIADGLERAADQGAQTITMSPVVDNETSRWPADRAAFVVWNTIFRFLGERGDKAVPAEIRVLVEASNDDWSDAMDKVVRTMLG